MELSRLSPSIVTVTCDQKETLKAIEKQILTETVDESRSSRGYFLTTTAICETKDEKQFEK